MCSPNCKIRLTIITKCFRVGAEILNANTEDPNSERFLQLKMVEIFCGLTYEEAAGMTLVDFQRVIDP